jgi:hypothetical protein
MTDGRDCFRFARSLRSFASLCRRDPRAPVLRSYVSVVGTTGVFRRRPFFDGVFVGAVSTVAGALSVAGVTARFAFFRPVEPRFDAGVFRSYAANIFFCAELSPAEFRICGGTAGSFGRLSKRFPFSSIAIDSP